MCFDFGLLFFLPDKFVCVAVDAMAWKQTNGRHQILLNKTHTSQILCTNSLSHCLSLSVCHSQFVLLWAPSFSSLTSLFIKYGKQLNVNINSLAQSNWWIYFYGHSRFQSNFFEQQQPFRHQFIVNNGGNLLKTFSVNRRKRSISFEKLLLLKHNEIICKPIWWEKMANKCIRSKWACHSYSTSERI